MPACRRFTIKEVQIAGPIAIVGPDDFVTDPASPIEAGEVLRDPRYSLYCFDPEGSEVLFVKVGDVAAVERAPFYYQGQRDQAAELVAMPMESFVSLSTQIPAPERSLIFVHSVGRCGSTLVSKVLESAPGVHSLSEPDDLTQLARLFNMGAWPRDRVRMALGASVAWRGRPASPHLAIKPRAEVMTLVDLMAELFPHARHLFLYRDGLAWMRTIFRGVPPDFDVYDVENNRKWEKGWADSMPLIAELRDEAHPKNMVQIRILAWVNCMELYLRLAEKGVPTCAARFEDLCEAPLAVLKQIIDFCEIEGVDWEAVEAVLRRDSQAGTIYDREERKKKNREMTAELVSDVLATIAARPLLGRPDVRLPGTITP